MQDAKQKMMKNGQRLLMMCLLLPATIKAQSMGEFLPSKIITTERYLFYQHGAVVTELGNNAINQSVPEWGPYEFLNILDSLKKRGFNVVSEIRKKGVPNSWYRDKISGQIDSFVAGGSTRSEYHRVGCFGRVGDFASGLGGLQERVVTLRGDGRVLARYL